MLTIEQVALHTNSSVKSIRRKIAAGSLNTVKHNNRYYITDLTTVENSNISIFTEQKKTYQRDTDDVNYVDISAEMNIVDGWNNPGDVGEVNFIDLFAGAGGLSCGLVMAGLKPVGAVEIMESAVATYKRNFGSRTSLDEHPEVSDIRQEQVKRTLIEQARGKHIHLITGGFPCQGFSLAGHRIVDDERNSLYREMLSVVAKVKPDFVLMENVEGLRSMLGGAVERKIIEDYAAIGYDINVTVLNAADYGVPQIRKRVIFIGNRLGKLNLHPAPCLSPAEYKTVKDGIERFMDIPENKAENHIFTRHSADITERLKKLPQGSSLYENYSDAWKRVYWDMPSTTVKENHGGVNVHPLLPRVMTPRELAALQSFPDDFIFEGTKKWQLVQIGNAVPPLLGKAIGLAIKKAINGETQNVVLQRKPKEYEQPTLLSDDIGGK